MNLINLMYAIPQLLILIACINYLRNKTSMEGVLLFGGSLVGLLIRIFHTIGMPFLFENHMDYAKIMTLISPISLMAYIAFAVGFFMLISKLVYTRNFEKDSSDAHLPR